MNTINTVLNAMKSKLSVIPNIKTCKIGIEANLNPDDYPIIRLQVNGFRKSSNAGFSRLCDLYIYFGVPLTEGETSIETITTELLELESTIIEATRIGDDYRSSYVKTIVSGSEVEHYRLMVIVLEVEFTV